VVLAQVVTARVVAVQPAGLAASQPRRLARRFAYVLRPSEGRICSEIGRKAWQGLTTSKFRENEVLKAGNLSEKLRGWVFSL